MSTPFNEQFRHGSAHFADVDELRRAGLFERDGPQIGYMGQRPFYLGGDAPLITIGGAGSGKLRDILSYVACCSPGQRMLILDPRGEIASISMHMHASHGEYAYCWNPLGISVLPRHACNPLDILKPGSPTLFADTSFIAEGILPPSGADNGKYFEQRGQEWLSGLIVHDVMTGGGTSLPRVHGLVGLVESGSGDWPNWLESMLASPHSNVRRIAGEMLSKQQDSPREFGSIMGEIYAHLRFLDDPALRASLERSDFSLAQLADGSRASKMFLNVPAEYLGIWSPVVRLFFTTAMLYKTRAPSSPRVMLLVDEAGQLGRFEALLRAFTYGRGAGIRAWAVFQDAGQIVRHYGAPALQSFLGSAQMRQFFGVRDYQTARLVSDMLGQQTLEYDDTLQQARARHQKAQTVRRVLGGEDPFSLAAEYRHFEHSSEHRSSQARPLMSPDEVLAMPEDQQIAFISGRDLPPVLANKYAYFERREMAGKHLPNPAHPPLDRVRVAGRWGSSWREVLTGPVPPAFADYPQYRDGTWSYVRGYRPG